MVDGMRSLIRKILVAVTTASMLKKYGSYWAIREAAMRQSGFMSRVLTAIFDSHQTRNGSWIGPGARFEGPPCFPHGMRGIFISNEARIGSNCVIFQQVTIGSNTVADARRTGSPTLGHRVYIGAGAKIIGGIVVGDGCRVGANAVVYSDLAPSSLAVAHPTRIIERPEMDNRYFSQRADGSWVYYDDGNWRPASGDEHP